MHPKMHATGSISHSHMSEGCLDSCGSSHRSTGWQGKELFLLVSCASRAHVLLEQTLLTVRAEVQEG